MVVLLGTVLSAGTARANRPLNTDTADTIAAGRCQFEPYAGRSSSRDATAERLWVLQVSCGATDRSQFGAGLLGAGGEAAEHRIALAGKTALYPLADGRTGLSVGYGVSAARPSAGSWAGEGAVLYAIASRELTDGWLGHANLGWSCSRSAHQSSTTWALATEYAVGAGVVLSAEAYGDDRSRPWTAAGAAWRLRPGATVNASYGIQHESPRVRQWTVGFLVEF